MDPKADFVDPADTPSDGDKDAARPTGGIRVEHLIKTFRRKGSSESVTAVNDVTLEAGPTEMLVLLGPSGCGKTTLLRCIAGLEEPESGRVIIGDRTVFSSGERIQVPTNKREVSMIFQSYSLWPHMTVGQNVGYPLRSRGVKDRRAIEVRVNRVLALVGLVDLGREHPGTLSGGQQQRVSLARALVTDPAAILFDEPLSNIDAKVRTQLRDEIRSMHTRVRFAGIYVTHDQEEALSLGTRIAVLDDGVVAQLGTPEDVYNNPATRYVAEFVGRANTVAGTVVAVRNGEVEVTSALGRVFIDASVSPAVSVAQEVFIVVRPEDLVVSTSTEDARGTLGVVTAIDYQGPSYDLSIGVQGSVLRVIVPKWERLPTVGDEVIVDVMPARARLVVE